MNNAVTLQQQAVRDAYAQGGLANPRYEAAFAALSEIRLRTMADQYRRARGLPPDAKTPYHPK